MSPYCQSSFTYRDAMNYNSYSGSSADFWTNDNRACDNPLTISPGRSLTMAYTDILVDTSNKGDTKSLLVDEFLQWTINKWIDDDLHLSRIANSLSDIFSTSEKYRMCLVRHMPNITYASWN